MSFNNVEGKILTIRNQQGIRDGDVAELYGVEITRINDAEKNNPDKFPGGYILKLSKKRKKGFIEIFDTPKIKFSPVLTNAFTEKELYMQLSTILRSEKATQMTIDIVEIFANIRELLRLVAKLPEATGNFKQKSLMQKGGEIIADTLDDSLNKTESKRTIELNVAILKFKNTVKRKQ